ncbi:MAG: hypothetical protein GSR82_00265 [Desulfurococcales archaeon]|nr:hypothetical protein [Desulfurococcales archaeon]
MLMVKRFDSVDKALDYLKEMMSKYTEGVNETIQILEEMKERVNVKQALREVLEESLNMKVQKPSNKIDLGGIALLMDPDEEAIVEEYIKVVEDVPRRKEAFEKLIAFFEKLSSKGVKAKVEILEVGGFPQVVTVKIG